MRLGRQHDPVREHDLGQGLDVVGQRVVAPLQQRARLRGAQQQQAGPRAGPELDARVLPGAVQQADDVLAQRVGGVDAQRRVLRGAAARRPSATGSIASTRSPVSCARSMSTSPAADG